MELRCVGRGFGGDGSVDGRVERVGSTNGRLNDAGAIQLIGWKATVEQSDGRGMGIAGQGAAVVADHRGGAGGHGGDGKGGRLGNCHGGTFAEGVGFLDDGFL